jgi:hypothetical protein
MRIGTFEVEIAGRPGTVGFEDEIEPAGIENPITDNVDRVLHGAGYEDGDAGEGGS